MDHHVYRTADQPSRARAPRPRWTRTFTLLVALVAVQSGNGQAQQQAGSDHSVCLQGTFVAGPVHCAADPDGSGCTASAVYEVELLPNSRVRAALVRASEGMLRAGHRAGVVRFEARKQDAYRLLGDYRNVYQRGTQCNAEAYVQTTPFTARYVHDELPRLVIENDYQQLNETTCSLAPSISSQEYTWYRVRGSGPEICR